MAAAYPARTVAFGPEYLIPKPFDPRLIVKIAPAVAQAGHGIRRRDPPDPRLGRLPPASSTNSSTTPASVMKPVFRPAKRAPKRIIFAEGEDERVLRAVQVVR